MHEFFRVGHHAAEGLADGLVTQAHPQDGEFARQLPRRGLAHPRIRGPAGAGREDQVAGVHPADVLHRHGIVAHHLNIRVQAPHQLVQVVRKAVVVVDEQDHRSLSFWASSRARTTAWALLMHS